MSSSRKCTVAIIDLSLHCAHQKRSVQADMINWRFGGMTVLEWLSRRLTESMLLDQIVITGSAQYLPLVQACSLGGTCWMPSPHKDAARRAYDIAQRTDAAWLLIANMNSPLVEPSLTDRQISEAWKNPGVDYIGFVGQDRHDIGAQSYGLAGQLCSVDAVAKLVDKQVNNCDDVPNGIMHHLETLQMRLLPLPKLLGDSSKRFAVNCRADLDRVEMYLESNQEDLTWQRLLQMAEVAC